jgi:hypothetical protein
LFNKSGPEAVLENYVRLAFSSSPDQTLEKYFTSSYLKKIRDEQDAANNKSSRGLKFENLKLLKFEIQNKECLGDGVCKMRYFISYNEMDAQKKTLFNTETKKVAILKLDQDRGWLIDEIDHMKTIHDMKEELRVNLHSDGGTTTAQ